MKASLNQGMLMNTDLKWLVERVPWSVKGAVVRIWGSVCGSWITVKSVLCVFWEHRLPQEGKAAGSLDRRF